MPSIGDFFKKAAPYLSVGLSLIPGGGPAAQILTGVVSNIVGKPVEPKEVAQTVSDLATTEQGRIQLQQIENSYSQAMQQLQFDNAEKLAEVAAGDRASARDREKTLKDKVPAILALATTLGFFGLLGTMLFVTVPSSSEKIIDIMVGALGAAWTQSVMGYYFGSSATHDAMSISGAGTGADK